MKEICGARTRSGTVCQNPPVTGKTRCRIHGGLSTGPRTKAGKIRQAASVTKHGKYSKTFSTAAGKLTPEQIQELRRTITEDPEEIYKEIILQLMIKLQENDNPREISQLSNQILRYMKELKGKQVTRSRSREELKKIVKERLIALGIKIVGGAI